MEWLVSHWHIALGIMGLIFCSCGAWLPRTDRRRAQRLLAGSIALFAYSILDGSRYYILLEIVAVLGATLAFTSLRKRQRGFVVIFVSVIILTLLVALGDVNGARSVLGSIALLTLGMALAIATPRWYAVGAFLMTIYGFWSFYASDFRSAIACLFGVLNTVLFVAALHGCLAQERDGPLAAQATSV